MEMGDYIESEIVVVMSVWWGGCGVRVSENGWKWVIILKEFGGVWLG